MLQLCTNDFKTYPPLKLEMIAHHFPLWFTLYIIFEYYLIYDKNVLTNLYTPKIVWLKIKLA